MESAVDIVTLEELESAMRNALGKKGMREEKIKELSEYIMNLFGFCDCVIDSTLSNEDRDIFYMLEEQGFLKVEMEEVTLAKGKNWRIHYWLLNKANIRKYACIKDEEKKSEYAIYSDIPNEVWKKK
ncbi:MAG: DUF6015 family protein [Candidatus Thermoplasmatota archaeon]